MWAIESEGGLVGLALTGKECKYSKACSISFLDVVFVMNPHNCLWEKIIKFSCFISIYIFHFLTSMCELATVKLHSKLARWKRYLMAENNPKNSWSSDKKIKAVKWKTPSTLSHFSHSFFSWILWMCAGIIRFFSIWIVSLLLDRFCFFFFSSP